MKVPYISAYIEEFPLKESTELHYDNKTQINYIDEEMKIKAVSFIGPDTTVLTETVENRDEQECYLEEIFVKRKAADIENEKFKTVFGPDTTVETFTNENTDRDEYQFLGLDTTIVTKILEGRDLDSVVFGPKTTVETNTVENSDVDSTMLNSIMIERATMITKLVDKYKEKLFYGPDTTTITRSSENTDEN